MGMQRTLFCWMLRLEWTNTNHKKAGHEKSMNEEPRKTRHEKHEAQTDTQKHRQQKTKQRRQRKQTQPGVVHTNKRKKVQARHQHRRTKQLRQQKRTRPTHSTGLPLKVRMATDLPNPVTPHLYR